MELEQAQEHLLNKTSEFDARKKELEDRIEEEEATRAPIRERDNENRNRKGRKGPRV